MSDASTVLFVGSYAAADQPGIRAFRLDLGADRFDEIGGWSGVANPSYLTLSSDGRHLYAVSETGAADAGPGRVHAFDVDWSGDAPELEPTGGVPSGGDHPCHLGLDPQGRWLAVSNYGSGSVSVIDLDVNGRLGTTRSMLEFRGGSVDPQRQGGPHAHSATPSPDGRHLLVADLGGDRFVSLRVDDELVECGRAPIRPGAGPRHAAVRADGLVVVANELDNTVSTHRLGSDGSLTPVDTATTLPDDAPENLVAEVCLAADGRTAFVSNRGHDSIASFEVGADGTIGRRTIRPCGGRWPRHFTLLPDGRHLVVANERSDALVVVPVADGPVVVAAGMPSPTCVVVHPARG